MDRYRSKTHTYVLPTRDLIQHLKTQRLKVSRWKKVLYANGNQKKARELPCWFSGKESACQCRRHRFDT